MTDRILRICVTLLVLFQLMALIPGCKEGAVCAMFIVDVFAAVGLGVHLIASDAD